MDNETLRKAVGVLQSGKIIAYPTEGMYGLGCDPFNKDAVVKLVKLKQRQLHKGLILVGYSFEQFKDLVQQVPEEALSVISKTWPGPITWVFPATENAPKWITGNHHSVAIRISVHPVVQGLCRNFNKPIVSTSANLEGSTPIYKEDRLKKIFKNNIDMIVPGKICQEGASSEIRDVLTGKVIRPGMTAQQTNSSSNHAS
jgi:L-threonylcarbamoyladenylate synthase